MSLKTVVMLAVIVVAGAVGDVLVSKGMKAVGEVHSFDPAILARTALRALRQPFVILGALCLALYFFSFLTVLSWADVSLVVPITALSFLLTTFLAQWALHERVTPLRWTGTLLIVTGVALVARSAAPKAPGPEPAAGAAAALAGVAAVDTDEISDPEARGRDTKHGGTETRREGRGGRT